MKTNLALEKNNFAEDENPQRASLDWISPGLSDAITDSLNAIESYLAGTPNPEKLHDAKVSLTTIEKALLEVSIPSAALLSQHLIELCDYLVQERRHAEKNYMGDDNAFPALYGGVSQLANYLETLKKTRNECISAVLPVVNDIRAVSYQSLLVGSDYFDIAILDSEEKPYQNNLTSPALLGGDPSAWVEGRRLSQLIYLNPDFDLNASKALSHCCHTLSGSLADEESIEAHAQPSLTILQDTLSAIQLLLDGSIKYRCRLSLAAKATIRRCFFSENESGEAASEYHSGSTKSISSEQLLREVLFCVAVSTCSLSNGNKEKLEELTTRYKMGGVSQHQADPLASQLSTNKLSIFKLGTPEIAVLGAIFSSLRRDVEVLKQAAENVMSSQPNVDTSVMMDLALAMKYTLDLLERNDLVDLSDAVVALFKKIDAEGGQGLPKDQQSLLAELAEKLESLDSGLYREQFGSRRSEAELSALEESKQTLLRIRENLLARNESEHGFDSDALLMNFDALDTVSNLLVQTIGALKILQIEDGVVALSACHQQLEQQRSKAFDEDAVVALIAVLSTMITFLEAAKFCQQDKVFNQLKSQVSLLAPSFAHEFDSVLTLQEEFETQSVPENSSAEDGPLALVEVSVDATVSDVSAPELEGIKDSEPESSAILIPLQNTIDDEIAEIFLEEATEVMEDIHLLVQSWQDIDSQSATLMELRRAYHTLKGSGRMAGAEHIGELASSIENLLSRICNNALALDEPRVTLIAQANQLLPSLIDAFAQRVEPAAEPMANIISNVALSISDNREGSSEHDTVVPNIGESSTANIEDELSSMCSKRVHEVPSDQVVIVEELSVQSENINTGGIDSDDSNYLNFEDGSEESRSDENNSEQSEPEETAAEALVDTELQAIFIAELSVQLAVVGEYIEAYGANEQNYPREAVERAFHTLLGSARIVGNVFVASLVSPLELMVRAARRQESISFEHHQLITIAYHYLRDCLSISGAEIDVATGFIDKLVVVASEDDQFRTSAESVNQCLDDDIVFNAHDLLQQWRVNGEPPMQLAAMESGLQQIESAANEGQHLMVVQLCESLLSAYRIFSVTGLHYQAYAAMANGHLELENLLDCVAVGQTTSESGASHLLNELVVAEQALVVQAEVSSDTIAPTAPVATLGLDQEIVATFLDECEDLIEELESGVQHWLKHRTDMSYLQSLLRPLHTIKGGARMAGLEVVGNLSHEFETLLQSASNGDSATDDDFFDATRIAVSELTESINQVSAQMTAKESSSLCSDAASDVAEVKVEDEKRNTEMVRVSADLLENLVNLAGETSISRSLVEDQLSDLAQNIEEIDSTVERLKGQLRRLEIETQAQIEFRKEQVESAGSEGFDPLEMDRYSQVQQLSKSLLESASDLTDLKGTLSDKNRDMETLLLQQSRINTSLQEGLMQTRTVPISRYLTPRLRRIVRQVSGELDKPVTFDVQNAGGELDRSMIERVVTPLEHVLRNAIDHGIESIEQRRQLGKAEQGLVSLSIRREGSDVVLSLSDDGSGIDVDAVKTKAIAQGLMAEDETLSSDEIMQFIFAPGFSTAKSITQISGRGVGMDVVQSEIRDLGGSIQLRSQLGSGTEFIFRLPFTVSMNRALLVYAAGETLAVPLDTIEGIVRVSPYELQEYYGDNAAEFFYAGQRYDFTYLGSLINGSDYQVNNDMLNALPVLLVRGGDRFVAIQVDKLLGSREIVVKSLGAQFAQLDGISGATLLGDGSVVMIADLVALVRSGQRVSAQVIAKRGEQSKTRLTAMVVDDSVTVRKVTTRLLERKDIDVRTAKDGLEAMALLEEVAPDFILLDIEMPRMDGFEVVARVRKDERFKDIPVIMITSRAGEKHKERAFELGANQFLGKPYQEKVLFSAIDQVLPRVENQQHLALRD